MEKLTKLEEKIILLKNRRDELFALKQPIDKELMLVAKELGELEEKRDETIAKEKADDWSWLLKEDGVAIREKHRVLDAKLEKFGLVSIGCNQRTQQSLIQMALTKGNAKSLTKTIAGLQLILPFIKAEEDGFKYFKIFCEQTVSENWRLVVSNKKFNITRFGRIMATYSSLEKAIKYIQENLWYRNDNEDDS